MALGENSITVLGTVVVAALAVGAAVGTHALLGDATVEAAATPSVTTSVSLSGDFCTVMGELNTYYASRSAESGVLDGTIDLTAAEDPAVLEALHKQADPLLEITAGIATRLAHGADVVGDAAVADALRTSSAYAKASGEALAKVSRDATSVEGFIMAAMGAVLDPSLKPTAGEADAAGAKVRDYVTTTCAIDISAVLGAESSGDSSDGSSSSTDTAKNDASTLGEEISAAFVDWKAGDPLPEVSLADGTYGVVTSSTSDGGTSTGTSAFTAASTDPAIVDQSITGPLDWCVSVTDNAATPPTTYRYSATAGVEEGTCAALAST